MITFKAYEAILVSVHGHKHFVQVKFSIPADGCKQRVQVALTYKWIMVLVQQIEHVL